MCCRKPSISKEVANILGGGRKSKKLTRKIHQNYDFTFTFNSEDGPCQVTMTSVAGHITGLDFGLPFVGKLCSRRLFEADIETIITKKSIYENIAEEARNADKLMIWTDCDREGEYIDLKL